MLSQLNHQQKEAVTCGLGPVVVIAGAGTGKTTVLISRVVHLVNECHIPLAKILAITFTNKAANEMKTRINQVFPQININTFRTIHGLCNYILQQDIHYLKRLRFTIIDTNDQKSIINDIIKTLVNSEKIQAQDKRIHTAVFKFINQVKVLQLSFDDVAKDWRMMQQFFITDKNILNLFFLIYDEYEAYLKRDNLLDFEDLLNYTIKLFQECPDVLTKWKSAFDYILVDEFQDVNLKQLELINMLVNDQKNIFIVGDYDQTIYSFRGSYPKIFSDFLNKYPQAMVFPLEYNYRSTKKILKLANHVIKNNKLERFIDKQLVGNNDSGDDVSLYRGHYEAKFVINEITKLIETKKYQYKDIVILYRSNSCSRKIEEELIKQSIPYHVYGTRKFYDRKEVKDLIAYLNLFNDKVKDIYVKRIINVPKRKITQSIVDKIEEYAYTTKNSFFNAVQKFAFENPHVNAFVKLIDELTIVSQQNQSISAFVKILVEKINYQQYLNDTEEVEVAIEKFHNVEQLISGIEEFEKNFFNNQKINATIADFLNEISLYTDLIDDSQVDFVNLMTIHAVKGLEFPVVFIAFINRGIMPSAYASSQLEIEEERRMLYVAITRAKNKLYMTCDKHDFSSYINEFGNDNFVIVNDSFQEINQQDWYDSNVVAIDNNQDDIAWEIGDICVIAEWGEGVVIDIINNDYLKIAFKNNKKISLFHRKFRGIVRKN